MEGFDKIEKSVRPAADRDYEHTWIDSCYIDKGNSAMDGCVCIVKHL
jgi:hypothetical protein